jgi:hypothetical protein
MKFLLLLTFFLLDISILSVLPAQSLPGESKEIVVKKFKANQFFQELKLYQGYFPVGQNNVCCVRGSGIFSLMNGNFLETYYSILDNKIYLKGPGRYKSYNFSYSFNVNLDRKIVYQESLNLSLNARNKKYSNSKKYDLRKDTLIIEVMTQIWGKSLVDDFMNAKLTNVRMEGGELAKVYSGKKYAYKISSSFDLNEITKQQEDAINIFIIIPEYIEAFRVQLSPD